MKKIDVSAAAKRLASHVHETPVVQSRHLNERIGADCHFKCENLQRTGAFKIRGATNAVLQLEDNAAARGVATHSSGNHGAALAAAAAHRGIPSYIVVPRGAVRSKVRAIRAYGGQVIECEPTQAAREAGLAELIERTGASPIHPYDDARVIEGQGTASWEFLEQVEDLDVLIAPIGGGGLISGAALAIAARGLDVRLIGAEPAGADDTARSLRQGRRIEKFSPDTVADGLRAHVGRLTFEIIRDHVAEVITVSDEDTIAAQLELMNTLKLVVEPSAATVWAAALTQRQSLQGQRVGLILSGGNADLSPLGL